MRKITIVTLLVIALSGAALYVSVIRPFSGELSLVRKLSEAFMEDLQFKDFRSSSLYSHVLDIGRIDIGRAIEELFLVKPELLDLMDYRISKAELDQDGERARVVITTRYKLLNRDKAPRESDIILYWAKRHPDCPLGGRCDAGVCVDERGEKQYRPEEGLDEEAKRRTRNPTTDMPHKEGGEPYACDSSAEPRWFMNLDSTLKHKDYR